MGGTIGGGGAGKASGAGGAGGAGRAGGTVIGALIVSKNKQHLVCSTMAHKKIYLYWCCQLLLLAAK